MNKNMSKKEFKVGEIFRCGLTKLQCIEGNVCFECFFEEFCENFKSNITKNIIGNCSPILRKDKTSVIFKEIK